MKIMAIGADDLRRFLKALRTSYYASRAQDEATLIANSTGPLVDEFPSVAGSISTEGTKMLWLVTRYFSPKMYVRLVLTLVGPR